MKNLEKRNVRSHSHYSQSVVKVRALFAENKVHFARAEQLCHKRHIQSFKPSSCSTKNYVKTECYYENSNRHSQVANYNTVKLRREDLPLLLQYKFSWPPVCIRASAFMRDQFEVVNFCG